MESLDYKSLCQTLFGTSDTEELAQIADVLQSKNPRHAGRKRKFTEVDIAEMRKLQRSGMSITEIAARYHTTRQTVGKYINIPPAPGYTLRLTLMYQRQPCTVIDVDPTDQKIRVQNKTDNILHCAFGTKVDPTWKDFFYFLQRRCFSDAQGSEEVSVEPGFDVHDLLKVMKKTRGKVTTDDLWVRFQHFQLSFI